MDTAWSASDVPARRRTPSADASPAAVRLTGPTALALGVVIAGFALAQLLELFTNAMTFPLARITVGDVGFGFDFLPYYDAANVWLRGGNPYLVRGTTTLPLSIVLATPFTLARFVTASYLNALTSVAAMGGALALSIHAGRGRLEYRRDWPLFLLLVLGYPFAFLVSRGNVEYWVWLLMAVGFWLEVDGSAPWLAGLMLGLGALLKLYPLLLILPLVALRRRATALAMLAVTLLGLTMPHTLDFVTGSLGERLGRRIDLHQNGSVIGLAHYLLGRLGLRDATPAIVLGLAVVAAAFVACVWRDWHRARVTPPRGEALGLALASYLPFVGTVPSVAYCYVLVGLILALPFVESAWWQAPSPRAQRALALFAVGLGLAYAPVYPISYALSEAEVVHVLPPLGNLLCMAAAVWLKCEPITTES